MEHELYNIEPKEFKVLDRVEIDNNLRVVQLVSIAELSKHPK